MMIYRSVDRLVNAKGFYLFLYSIALRPFCFHPLLCCLTAKESPQRHAEMVKSLTTEIKQLRDIMKTADERTAELERYSLDWKEKYWVNIEPSPV